MPKPKSSTPALLEATVRFFTPDSLMAFIEFSGIPHNPNPPEAIDIPSNSMPSKASEADL